MTFEEILFIDKARDAVKRQRQAEMDMKINQAKSQPQIGSELISQVLTEGSSKKLDY